ncbi:MAG: sulfatase-like hydrolase/transferase [Chitinivibrionales bacterium]|nr:sulfatase-like hydrolase/transferase [Chitinivibrionales bacterium]
MARTPAKYPNLLFIYTDEQAYNTLAAYGNTAIHMPNLNRLAQRCTVFDRAYVTQPVCTPSRSSLLTGLYPHKNGCTENNIPLSEDIPCLPEMIERGDYATAHFGKWHLGDEIFAQHGFEQWRSIEDHYSHYFSKGRDKNSHSSYHDFLLQNGFTPTDGSRFSRPEAARMPEQFGKPAYLAQEASSFIRQNSDHPFVLYVNFFEPHMPFFGPRDNQYDPASIPLPPNFDCPPAENQPLKTRLLQEHYLRYGHSGLPLQTPDDWRKMIANYWGLCSLIDTHIGTILSTMDQHDLWDNTIVVFTSDHGDMMGSRRLVGKYVMFEEAIRVPLMIGIPGQHNGRRVRGPVSQIDIVPTLLDLMGQPVHSHLQGKSLCPLLDGRRDIHREDVFVEWNGANNGLGDKIGEVSIPQWMNESYSKEKIESAMRDPVRTIINPDGWKYCWSSIDEDELYNLNDDPLETRNLAADRDFGGIKDDLKQRIKEWKVGVGDKV